MGGTITLHPWLFTTSGITTTMIYAYLVPVEEVPVEEVLEAPRSWKIPKPILKKYQREDMKRLGRKR